MNQEDAPYGASNELEYKPKDKRGTDYTDNAGGQSRITKIYEGGQNEHRSNGTNEQLPQRYDREEIKSEDVPVGVSSPDQINIAFNKE